ncbi:molybdate ABC transporter permease subunit [Paenibacillus xerothermodurans]|uniref:Molybdenum transport system permease n=2 Tax=Paenibacillus xerothermodurans TaxID=1977292 RepID=A0A2W1NK44_PAEXE|nr:molybdate ABC transporter permease subunit [Paenibacillus xerothermodurans]
MAPETLVSDLTAAPAVVPPAAAGAALNWHEFAAPITLSVQVALTSSVIVFVLGTLAAWWMSKHRSFPGRTLLETVLLLPLVLPPTVVGFILLVSAGRKSSLGRAIEWLFGQPLVFTWWAAVLAAVVVAFPLVYQTMKVGFLSVDSDLLDAARSMGASEPQLLRWIIIPLAWRSLLTAYVLGFARSLGEFGATLMVAGNIPGKTQTLPTAIYVAVDSGNLTLAWWWTVCMMLISFIMLLSVSRKKAA